MEKKEEYYEFRAKKNAKTLLGRVSRSRGMSSFKKSNSLLSVIRK